MSLRSLFDGIVAKSMEARKCYDLGMYAESVHFCSMVEDDARLCIQEIRQAIESQSSEPPFRSGESSMEGSVTMEGTPPQMLAGVSPSSLKRKQTSSRPQGVRKTSRPSSPPTQRQLAPQKAEPTTPPSGYYKSEMTTPQQHPATSLIQPQTIVASQSLPHDLNLLQAQGAPFMTPQIPQSPYGGFQGIPVFRSQPSTPYFSPTTLRPHQVYQSPTTDFARQSQLNVTNPMNLIDPRGNPGLQFRRPSEPTIPTHHATLSQPTPAPQAPPAINLPGQVISFAAPTPQASSGGESPFPPNLLPQLDQLFVAFLQKVVSDESITDSRGEALHHPLPPRKQQKIAALALTAWRPVKLRIQAFTSAFQEELARTLAAGMNLARHEVSIKRVREYLWTRDLIARYNPSGRKAKSRGSHVWCVEARRRAEDPHAEWEFRPWKRKIQVVRDNLMVPWGHPVRLPLKVWDPQVQYEDLEVKFSAKGPLPPWLTWENESTLIGTPPPANEDSYKIAIPVSVTYTAFGMTHVIDSRLELDVRRPGNLNEMVLRGAATMSFGAMRNMEPSMEAYLDDDDDDMMYMGQNAFSSENTTPQSAIAPSIANPNQLLYVPSHSLQNPPLQQTIGRTPPGTTPTVLSMNQGHLLTPSISPVAVQYNPHLTSLARQPSSAPQTPIGRPPSQLSLQLPQSSHDTSSHSASASDTNVQFMNEVQPSSMVYASQGHMTPTSSGADSGAPRAMYGIDEELSDNHSIQHNYFEDSYPLELGSPFLER